MKKQGMKTRKTTKKLKMPTERLTLAQIQSKYWNKWVAMADMAYEPKSFALKDAIVLCASKNRGLAYKKQLLFDEGPYQVFAVTWIGDATTTHPIKLYAFGSSGRCPFANQCAQ